MAEKNDAPVPPYVPYSTFIAFLDRLKQTVVPGRIEPTIMTSMSGATQSHLKSAMRFLGLIDSAGAVQAKLRKLVEARGTENWYHAVVEDLYEPYLNIIGDVGLDTTTPGELRDVFLTRGGVNQQMREKAIRFFLSILDDAKMTYSPFLKERGARAGGRSKANGKGGSTKRKKVESEKTRHEASVTPARSKIPEGFIDHPFQLRRELMVNFQLPDDLTTQDVERINRFLKSLPIDASGD